MSDDLISRKALFEEIQSFRCSIMGLRAGKGVLAHAEAEYRKSILQIIENQPPAFKKTEWIPIKEELPEERKNYLCTIECAGCRYRIIGHYNKPGWTHDYGKQETVAWMPLPEPYKGTDND